MGLNEIDRMLADWANGLQWPLDGVFRLFLAAICGGLVGLEREVRGRQAGFRTNLLVCLGSSLVMVVSMQFATSQLRVTPQPGINVNIDPARIAYSVMTGVGFLGAGTIVHAKGGMVRGLTTAAGLWCVAAIGLCAGFGLPLMTILATLMVLTSLWILDYIEDALPKRRYRYLIVRRPWEVGCIAKTVDYLKKQGMDVVDAAFERSTDLKEVDIKLHIAFVEKKHFYNAERELEGDTTLQLIETREA
jgi:putative Mg2+ transporter-C (MgtC) family protein